MYGYAGTSSYLRHVLVMQDIATHGASVISSDMNQHIVAQQSQTNMTRAINQDGFHQSDQHHTPVHQVSQTRVDQPRPSTNQTVAPNQSSFDRVALPQPGRSTPPKAIDQRSDLPLDGMFKTGKIAKKQEAAAASKTHDQPSQEGQSRPTEPIQ